MDQVQPQMTLLQAGEGLMLPRAAHFTKEGRCLGHGAWAAAVPQVPAPRRQAAPESASLRTIDLFPA